MIVVGAGSFMMGSPENQGSADEQPQHKVTITEAFAVSKFEVTEDQWTECMIFGQCKSKYLFLVGTFAASPILLVMAVLLLRHRESMS
jgi:formylglycine-generating enzyme required for sulfatase activity